MMPLPQLRDDAEADERAAEHPELHEDAGHEQLQAGGLRPERRRDLREHRPEEQQVEDRLQQAEDQRHRHAQRLPHLAPVDQQDVAEQAHVRPLRPPARVFAQRSAGDGEEDVVERRPRQVDRHQRRARLVEQPHQLDEGALAVVDGEAQRGAAAGDVADAGMAADRLPRPLDVAADLQRDDVAGDAPLQLVRRAFGDDAAVVDDQQPIGERVRLVEVVGGQEDGRLVLARGAAGPGPTGGCGSADRGRCSARRGTAAADGGRGRARCRAAGAGRRTASRPAAPRSPADRGRRRGLRRGAALRRATGRAARPAGSAPRPPGTTDRCRRPARRSRCARARPADRRAGRSRPRVAEPAVGCSSVVSIRSVVVLPAPFGPRKPTISPGSTTKSTPQTASTRPCLVVNARASPRASMIATAGALSWPPARARAATGSAPGWRGRRRAPRGSSTAARSSALRPRKHCGPPSPSVSR